MSFVSLASAALTAVLLSSGLFIAAADEVPTYNLSPSCHSETVTVASDRRCLQDEQQARDTLVQQWSHFAASDRTSCQLIEDTAGAPSYVELLTCLQMAASAKKLPND